MKTQYYTATSIDGYIADAENSLEWLFQFGGQDPAEGTDYTEFIAGIGAIAMGSTTYEWMLEHLIDLPDGQSGPWPYEQPCWVFSSRTLQPVEGADIRFVRGDVSAVHREMVEIAAGKNVWLVGGGELVGQFHDHGLLDEIIAWMAPVILGSGAPLLPRSIAQPPLRLISATPQGGIFVRLQYEVARPSE